MAKIKGICRNEDCDLCNQIQEVDKIEFVCEHCQQPLIPFGEGGSPGNKRKWIFIAGAAAVLLGGGGAATYFLTGDNGDAIENIQTSSSMDMEDVSNDTENAVSADNTTTTETTVEQNNTASIEITAPDNNKPAPKAKTGDMTIDLGFATYKGAVQNGKPHGSGTMTFKQEAVIPGSKGSIKAKAGDYAQGEWRNGEVNLVRLHQQGNDPQVITHK